MPNPALAIAGIGAGASIIGGVSQSKAANKAANAQVESNAAAIAEQRAARQQLERLLQPYTQAGIPALQQMMALAGIGGQGTDWAGYAQANPEIVAAYEQQSQAGGGILDYDPVTRSFTRGQNMTLDEFAEDYYNTVGKDRGHDLSPYQSNVQQQIVSGMESSPLFQGLARQGEDAILANASATGGLRGGNVQGALGQFRPALLNQFIQQQYGRLADLTQIGQNSAAGVGSSGLGVASNIGNIMMDSGAAKAGSAVAQGQIFSNTFGNLAGLIAGQIGGGAKF